MLGKAIWIVGGIGWAYIFMLGLWNAAPFNLAVMVVYALLKFLSWYGRDDDEEENKEEKPSD